MTDQTDLRQEGTVVVWGGNIEAIVFDLHVRIDESQSLLGCVSLGHTSLKIRTGMFVGLHIRSFLNRRRYTGT